MKKTKNSPEVKEKDMVDLIKALKSTGFQDYVQYLKSPRRVMMMNFLGGIFRGLGILVGMTIVVSLLVWFLTQLVDFPLIGTYFEDVLQMVEQLVPDDSSETPIR